MKKKFLSSILAMSLVFGMYAGFLPVRSIATVDENSKIIEAADVPLRLYYDEEASHGVDQGYDEIDTSFGSGSNLIEAHPNDDWERWSIPLGNGYFGANIFGRTDVERIQLTEKTLANPYRIKNDSTLPTDGLNNFSETYIDFGHSGSFIYPISNYSRELDLETAVSTVSYKYKGVTYTREYFTSYPDKAMVIKLDASSAGALDFVLRPTVPYEQEYMNDAGDGGGKTGTVTSSVTDGVGEVVLSGTLEYFDIDFVGLYKVYTNGGTVTATTCTNADGDTDGTITVTDATSAYIVITLGTDYELVSEQFTEARTNKPTFTTDLDDAMAKVRGYMSAIDTKISGKSFADAYSTLKSAHLADYQELFGRVSLDLNFDESDFDLTTDVLLENYKNGSGSTYLEALYFQYGRYLLIASSRAGALPANLQGAWNRYNHAPWSAGYWHNVNVQMNYWPAFSTNIAETFEAYVGYNNAYMAKAESGSNSIVNSYNPSVSGTDGGNGWSIATGGYVSDVSAATSIGNLGFTTQLFWEYYEYTKDEALLREVVYPVLVGAARFITKMVREDADGNYIAIYTDSPEQYVNGVWYYTDKGAAYAQSFAYQNNYNMLLAAKDLGISFDDTTHEDYAIIQTVMEQIDKYDPIRIGLSGQVKEFFEEEYYGDMGEYTHRHISQLVGLYPGNVINSTTPAWMDAAEYVLTERGDKATGWGVAHRLNLWARVQNGERAHDLLEQLLKVNTATNLWDLHPPFQIDGNLGGTAGISEMLLQSHAGYIEPLAAIPSSWESGSYTGLVARGNFEVSAAWADGVATTFNITSCMGGSVSVKYDGIENANLVDSEGKAVSYTAKGGIITFDTEAGETYIISGFAKETKPAAVEGLTINSNLLSTSTLSWNASLDAVSYNVYVAKDNSATYTLLKNTKATSYVYTPGENENSRLTFAVTAINTDGVESDRALVYRNPDDVSASVESVSASIVNDELQVAIKSGTYANKYRLYSRKNAVSEWSLVQESSYPIIIDSTYDSSLKYGVSVVSIFGDESETVAISQYNSAPVTVEYKPSNIFLGNQFDPTPEAFNTVHSSGYNYSKLTDGIKDNTGRFSTKNDTGIFDATVTLNATYILGELRIWDFNAWSSTANNAGTSLTIDIFYEGEWTTVIECRDNAEILAYRKCVSGVGNYLSFDLSGLKAQMIRICIPSTVPGNSISFYEIECSGVHIPTGKYYSDNLLLGEELLLSEYSTKHLHSSSGDLTKLTDGVLKTSTTSDYFYTWYNQTNMEFDALCGFDGEVILNKLRIYDRNGETNWANAVGPQIIIQAGLGDTWTTVHDVTIVGGAGNNINDYRKSGTRPNSVSGTTEYWLEFDLGGIRADRLRIYMPPRSTGHFGMYEIECDGYYSEKTDVSYGNNVFSGLQFVPTSGASGVIWNGSYSNLTDGVADDSHRLATAGTASYVDATLSFGEYVAALDTLTINYGSGYNKVRSGTGLIIQVFKDGVWSDALNVTYDTAYTGKVTYDLGHIEGSMVRLYVPGVYTSASGSLAAGDCIVIQEISCSGALRPAEYNIETIDNVFLNKTFVAGASSGKVWSGAYANMTDGVTSTRAAVNTAVDATADLGQVYLLNDVTINYDAASVKRCGSEVQIQVYYNGEWSTAATVTHTTTLAKETISLGGVKAEKVRLYIPSVYSDSTVTGDCIVIYEMFCTGAVLTEIDRNKEWQDDVFTGFEFEPTDSTASANIWSPNTYDKITDDGGTSSNDHRFASANGHTADGTLDFYGKVMELHTLTVNYDPYNAARCGQDFNIYVYRNGSWTQVLSYVHTAPTKVMTFELGGVEAEKVRFTITSKYAGGANADGQTGDCIVIHEMSCTGNLVIQEQSYEDKSTNVLLGTTKDNITLENATVHPSVSDLSAAFDGNTTSTRYAVLDAAGAYSLVIDLGENIPLYTLSIYDWRGSESTTRSDKTTVELYCDGYWIPIIIDQPLTVEDTHTDFDLMSTSASKIRITFNNTTSNSRATIYEITCTTGSAAAIDRSELLAAYKALAEYDTAGDASMEVIKQLKLDSVASSLIDTEATQDDIDAATALVNTEVRDMELGAPVTDEYGDLGSYNLTLSDNVAVNMYGEFADSMDTLFPNALVVIEYSDGSVEKQLLSELSRDASDRHVLKLNVLAKQMSDVITLRVVFDSDNCGEEIVTSVRDYADKVLASDAYASSHDLIKAMLNYGAYAQQYFDNYNVENLANEGIFADGENPVETGSFDCSENRKPQREGSFTGLRPAGWTLALESDVNIRFYFATENVYAYQFSVQGPDGAEAYSLDAVHYTENVYRVEIPTEDASMIDESYVLTISGEGKSVSITFSAIMYIDSIIAGDVSTTEQLTNIAKAMKLYCDAANAYVGDVD